MKIESCVAVVTGGAEGIGRAVCHALLTKGAKVAIFDVNDHLSRETAGNLQAEFGDASVLYIHCDVSVAKNWQDALKQVQDIWGKIQILVNNAALLGETDDTWEHTMHVILFGVIHGTKQAMELMSRGSGQDGGVIINTASVAGLGGFDMIPVYSSAKSGVVGFTRSMGTPYHFEKHGVRVNCVCPSAVDTKLTDLNAVKDHWTLDREAYSQLQMDFPKLKTEDVADAIISLIENDSKNGVVLRVTTTEGCVEHEFTQFVNV